MGCRIMMGLWFASLAVSIAATAVEVPYQTCAAVIALCLGFHLGIAFVILGIATSNEARRRGA